jgi:hypothetical protein
LLLGIQQRHICSDSQPDGLDHRISPATIHD